MNMVTILLLNINFTINKDLFSVMCSVEVTVICVVVSFC